jgi:hypothetical protein
MRRLAYIGLLGALACGDDLERWRDAKEQWPENAPSQYVAKSCGTGFVARFCTVSSVQDGEPLETLVQSPDGAWEAREPPEDVVMGMLEAATEDADGCDRRVDAHPTYEFPAEVYDDCGEEGYGIEITCFVEGTIDIAQCQ